MRVELIYIDNYIKAYYEELPKWSTYEQAYQEVEREYKKVTGRNRYTTYASFRVVLCRWMKENRRC